MLSAAKLAVLIVLNYFISQCQSKINEKQHYLVSNYLEVVQITDATSNTTSFLIQNNDFSNNMAYRHRLPSHKLYWHLFSGAAAFVPNLNSNILFERLIYSLQQGKGAHACPSKSFILFTQWDKNWTAPIGPSKILNVQENGGSLYLDDFGGRSRVVEGPEDARTIHVIKSDEIHINFNALTPVSDRQMFRQTVKFSESNSELNYQKIGPLVQFEHESQYRAKVEKNWTPILIKEELHYIYSLNPLRILKCEENKIISRYYRNRRNTENVLPNKKVCKVQFNGLPVNRGMQTGLLRGGTNWVEHSPGIFFSFARSRCDHRKCSKSIYRPHLIVMKFKINESTGFYSDPRIIFVSSPITEFDDLLFGFHAAKGLSSGNKCDDNGILTPGSISNWSRDSDIADVIISVNDDVNILLQIKGIDRTIQDILDSSDGSLLSDSELIINAENQMRSFVQNNF